MLLTRVISGPALASFWDFFLSKCAIGFADKCAFNKSGDVKKTLLSRKADAYTIAKILCIKKDDKSPNRYPITSHLNISPYSI